jgi:hypothetical protein
VIQVSNFLIVSVVLSALLAVVSTEIILLFIVKEQWSSTRTENADLRHQLLSHTWQEYVTIRQELAPQPAPTTTQHYVPEPVIDITDDVAQQQFRSFLEAVGENLEGSAQL